MVFNENNQPIFQPATPNENDNEFERFLSENLSNNVEDVYF